MNTLGWAASGAATLVVLLSLWGLDHARTERDSALKDVDSLTQTKGTLEAHNTALAGALADRNELQRQLVEVSRSTQRLNATLDTQSDLISRNFTELKRNDKAITDYLNSSVPAALGMLYARPDTTDPAAYRAPAAGMQLGPMPSTGTPATGTQ